MIVFSHTSYVAHRLRLQNAQEFRHWILLRLQVQRTEESSF